MSDSTQAINFIKVEFDEYNGEDGSWTVCTSRGGTSWSEAVKHIASKEAAVRIATAIAAEFPGTIAYVDHSEVG